MKRFFQTGLKYLPSGTLTPLLQFFRYGTTPVRFMSRSAKQGWLTCLSILCSKAHLIMVQRCFQKIISRAGGVDNAGTTRDYVFYHQKLAPDKLYLSIELEADRMRNLIMDPKETLAERDVVMEERRMRNEDDPQHTVYEELMSVAIKSIPYKWPVIGWMQDLKKVTRDDLWAFYRKHYVPNNAMIIIAGNIDVDVLMEKIRREFGSIQRGEDIKDPDIDEPEQFGERRLYVKKEAELPYVLSAYKAPNFHNDDSYALEVLAAVLAGGKSSRIYKSLIDEKRIALSADASYSGLEKIS